MTNTSSEQNQLEKMDNRDPNHGHNPKDIELDDRPEIIKALAFEIKLNAIFRAFIPLFLFIATLILVTQFPSHEVIQFTDADGRTVIETNPSGTAGIASLILTGAFTILNSSDFTSKIAAGGSKLFSKKEEEVKEPETEKQA